MPYFVIISIVLLVAIMGWGWLADRNGQPAGTPVLIGSSLALVACALILILQTANSPDLQLQAKEEAWANVRAHAIATHLATVFSDQKILVILPFEKTTQPLIRVATIQGLQTAFDAVHQNYQTLNPPMPAVFDHLDMTLPNNQAFDNTPSQEEWFTAKYLDTLLADKARGYDVVLCLPGMPQDASSMVHWKRRVRPLLAIGAIRQDVENTLLEQGRLAAAIGAVHVENFDNSFPPDDPETAFQLRYEILTPSIPFAP